jgi:hypothetical protein
MIVKKLHRLASLQILKLIIPIILVVEVRNEYVKLLPLIMTLKVILLTLPE